MSEVKKERLFNDIDADQQCSEIESLCMNCGKNGTTRMLLTSIPHFREVILMAFECPHCHERNNEIQSGGTIQKQGIKVTCRVSGEEDLNRQVIKSEHATIRVEELDFEIPSGTQQGLLNTIEGFLAKASEDLALYQDARKGVVEPEVWKKIGTVIEQLKEFADGKQAQFTFIVDDPTGNSYIENLCAPKSDPKLHTEHYNRTPAQCEQIGLNFDDDEAERLTDANMTDEVFNFPTNCSNCHAPAECKMKIVNIPYFKEIVLMSINCDTCAFKSTEVKAGGATADKGKKITLKVTDVEDLSRDILKSESCGLKVPEISLELEAGTLGGKFTTIEGLLDNVYEELSSRGPFSRGDSLTDERKEKYNVFLKELKALGEFSKPFTIILDDPLGNSYVQNLVAPDEDPMMTVEEYERTHEQNEDLGLNDMDVENHTTNAESGDHAAEE